MRRIPVAPTAETGDAATLTLEHTRIHLPGTHRADTKWPPKLEDAMDFWQFSGAAANVAMQLAVARPGRLRGVRHKPIGARDSRSVDARGAMIMAVLTLVRVFAQREAVRPAVLGRGLMVPER